METTSHAVVALEALAAGERVLEANLTPRVALARRQKRSRIPA